jgi:hypothetical protein
MNPLIHSKNPTILPLLLALALALAWLALMPMAQATNLSPTCQKIEDVIKGLQQHKQALADQLDEAAPALKPVIKEQIEELNNKIKAKKNELKKCIEEHPYVAPEKPKPLPEECAALRKEIEKRRTALSKEVRAAVAHLQEQLHDAPDKAQIIGQIKEKTADIKKNSPTAKKLADKIKEYDRCIIKYGGLPALDATFNGRATLMTSDDNAAGPFKQPVNIGLHFVEWDHSTFSVTSFPPISVTYDTDSPAGTVTTTVTKNGPSGGEFNPITNLLSVRLLLFFHHSTDWAGDSTLDITLGPSLLSSDGKITVEGSALFKDGYLDEKTCWLRVEGTISPRP